MVVADLHRPIQHTATSRILIFSFPGIAGGWGRETRLLEIGMRVVDNTRILPAPRNGVAIHSSRKGQPDRTCIAGCRESLGKLIYLIASLGSARLVELQSG